MDKKHILLGKFTEDALDKIIRKASEISNTGKRIDFLSRQFLDTDYVESTLIGETNTPEVFVINLHGVDCITFIEYVEAMRLSDSFPAFERNLQKVRYKSGIVGFTSRNHFFTDWKESNAEFVADVTGELGGDKTRTIQKTLNQIENGTYFLPGIEPVQRGVQYVPSDKIDISVLNKLSTGDYLGIYSSKAGLDVSHAGILIREDDNICLRHASSQKELRKVAERSDSSR